MNTNNRGNNNNRRRGRGGNRQQGGAQQLNRIDSRARGNAPQMLEKYRKLAHDAHLNGDRVQEETYLQFADHYFRVIADQRARQDDQRGPRRDERWQEGGENGYRDGQPREDGEDGGDYGGESEYQPYERQAYTRDDRPREPRPERQREERVEEAAPVSNGVETGVEPAADDPSPYEPPVNPFVRGSRGLRPRRENRRPETDGNRQEFSEEDAEEGPRGLDSILPPAIAAPRDEPAAAFDETEDAPAPRRRTRRPRPPADEAGESLEAAN